MKASLSRRFVSDFLFFSLLFAVCGGVFLAAAQSIYKTAEDTAANAADVRPVIVIDAGHGGEDGGASGEDGTREKDLNLTVAKGVAQILTAAGYDVRPTRTDDRLLYDLYGDLTDYTGHKKTYDLKNRLRFANEAEAALLVSIHMNKFSEAQYSGLQVYYSDSGKAAAELVQTYAKRYLQPLNDREPKRAGSAIYLLSRAEMPAIMIECGFLSNPEELSALTTLDYQKKLALTIAAAIAESVTAISP